MLNHTLPEPGALPGVRRVRHCGYDRCIELSNTTVRVTLDPNVGGRVLSYARDGNEILQQDPAQHGVRWDGRDNIRHPSGGRFDIGPEYGGIAHEALWFGPWNSEILGPRSACLTSPVLPDSGLQLVREFTLDPHSSHLRCVQRIRNRGSNTLRVFHWGRTFVPGDGIALAPLPSNGRFPRGYAAGGPPGVIDFLPAPDPNLRVQDGILAVVGPPAKPKLNFDVGEGWLAWLSQSGFLFVKRFPIYPERAYGELAANNASIWFGSAQNASVWRGREPVVEIEPIGPLEIIEPGGERTFTEEWWLEPFPFPVRVEDDLPAIRRMIGTLAPSSRGGVA